MNTDIVERTSSTQTSRGYLICFTGVVLWSLTGIFIRYLTVTYQMPPLILAFWRDLFLALPLIVALLILNPSRLKIDRSNLRFLFLYGLEISLFNSLWTISVALNGAAIATVLIYSSAVFTAILGWRLFSEALGLNKIIAVSLSLVGITFIVGVQDLAAWNGNPLGMIAGLLSGMGFAGYSLMGRYSAHKGMDTWSTLSYAFLFALPFLFLYNMLGVSLPDGIASSSFFILGNQINAWIILIFLAIGPTLAGFSLYTYSLSYLPASVANLIATLEPVITVILAYILLDERLTAPQWIGAILIMLGVVLLRWTER